MKKSIIALMLIFTFQAQAIPLILNLDGLIYRVEGLTYTNPYIIIPSVFGDYNCHFPPVSGPGEILQFDNNFVHVVTFSYQFINGQGLMTVTTPTGDAVCLSDHIFKDDFE